MAHNLAEMWAKEDELVRLRAEVPRLREQNAEMLDILHDVYGHFEHTDSPLGKRAAAAIAKAEGKP